MESTPHTHPAAVLIPIQLAAKALGLTSGETAAAIEAGHLSLRCVGDSPAVSLRDVACFHRDRAYRDARDSGDPAGNAWLLDHDESKTPDPEVLRNWDGDFDALRGYTDYLCDDEDACDRLFGDRREAFLVGRYLGQLDTHAQLVRYVRNWVTYSG